MKERIINENWYFHLEDEVYRRTGNPEDRDEASLFGFWKTGEGTGFAARKYEHHNWRKVTLPHDYVAELDFESEVYVSTGLKPASELLGLEKSTETGRANVPTFPVAWYRKEFYMSEDGEYSDEAGAIYGNRDGKAPQNKRYFLRFEGVYRDFTVFFNGVYMDRMTCGYLPLTLEVTDQLLFGETNTVAVRVDCTQYDGWWYDGGGIYRDVKLIETRDYACHTEDLYVHTEPSGEMFLAAEIDHIGEPTEAEWQICITRDGKTVIEDGGKLPLSFGKNRIFREFFIENPDLWDIDEPNLYTLTLSLNGEAERTLNFGFKDVKFDPDEGFFLNGKSRKLNGVCLHGDFACVGVALPYELTYHKYKVMKEMGVNAVRTAHNPPSPDVLDVCDRLGILLMDETRMFGSSPEAVRQLEALVRRDRNHACLLMWSIGNEEYIVQSCEQGARMARSARRTIERLTLDPIITYGAHNGGDYRGVNEEMDLRGVNYIRLTSDAFHPDDYHAEHPHQPMYSSEEMSSVSSRGVYKTDLKLGYVDAYGNNTMMWASTPMGFLKFCADRPYYCGSFAWTGFDYRGEPSPYWGGLDNPDTPRGTVSNFGIVDLCGFPKDVYYHYRAWWRPEPLLHLLPDWNGYEAGEEVRVVCFTNCEEVTLYLNGREISTVKNPPYGAPEWSVPYEAGELKAVGRKGDAVLTAYRRSDEPTVSLGLSVEDYGAYLVGTVDALDRFGEICNRDNRKIWVEAEGATVIGTGNGDPLSRLREVYFEEDELVPLPTFGERHFAVTHSRNRAPVHEEKHPRFDDPFRTVWKDPIAMDDELEEKTFTVEFTAETDCDFVEFPAILGEAHISLDGKEIGASYTPDGRASVRRRPYRFPAHISAGTHTLSVRIKSSLGYPTVLSDAFIGRKRMPEVSHNLFAGRMMFVLRRGAGGKVTVTDREGLCATYEIQ